MKSPALVLSAVLVVALGEATIAAEPLHWSFAPVRKPAIPAVKNGAWLKDGIDVFILAKLEAAGIAPNPDADRATLLRRATFDLTGLPPTPEELAAFVRDPAPDDAAFAKVVDRLLASPRFGERWARHWLDVVRYADSVGRTWNSPFLYAWRYRDWVIDSLNEDKPFSTFRERADRRRPAARAHRRGEALAPHRHRPARARRAAVAGQRRADVRARSRG